MVGPLTSGMASEVESRTFDHTPSSSAGSEMRLSFHPTTRLISSTRRFAHELLEAARLDPDATSRVALTIHELLENTLKYSADGEARLDVTVHGAPDGSRRIEVTARNRTTAERAEDLGRRILLLSSAEDPMRHYVELMRESVACSGSGLGLARIRVEAEMTLHCSTEGDSVVVRAWTSAEAS